MKTFASKYSCTQKSVQPIEHTPIYDIQAYNLRQRTRKRSWRDIVTGKQIGRAHV